TVTGAVSHQLVPAWLFRAHVGVAPYPQLEDFYFSPMKVVEYQAAGLAVVASDIGHLRQQIDDMETGILVRPGDAIQLAGALARHARQPELTSRLGRQARSRVLGQCTWAQVADRVTDLIDRHSTAPMRLAVAGGYGW
ncbi:MAG: glycosyltransferase family 4 protein, partial [Acidobacteria bacterium]|nr:glycosyltransferase family 4 protein [Acidobacteriota bacterium]